MDKNLFVNTGDMGLDPWSGKILTLEPILHKKRSYCKEKPSQHSEELEKAPGQQ